MYPTWITFLGMLAGLHTQTASCVGVSNSFYDAHIIGQLKPTTAQQGMHFKAVICRDSTVRNASRMNHLPKGLELPLVAIS